MVFSLERRNLRRRNDTCFFIKVKSMRFNQMISLSPLLGPRSLAQRPCTIRTGLDIGRAA